MNARERLYLVIFALILGTAAVFVGGAALSMFSLERVQTSLAVVFGNKLYLLVSMLLAILALLTLYLAARRHHSVETLVQQGPCGEMRISFKAVETLVLKAANGVKGVKDIKTKIVYSEPGLVIFLRAVTLPDQNLPQMTADLQTVVKEYVENATGSTVAEIKVLIENVVSDTVRAAR